MPTNAYFYLNRLLQRFDSSATQMGKPVQLLFALSLHRSGWTDVIDRLVEGTDIEATDPSGVRWLIECKTTSDMGHTLQKKDCDGFKAAEKDKKKPGLAFCRIRPLSNWMLVEAVGLEEKYKYSEASLRLFPQHRNSEAIQKAFLEVCEREVPGLLDMPPDQIQNHLNNKVKDLSR
mgnify:FL=1